MTEQIRKRVSKIYAASLVAIIFSLLMASNALLYAAEQGVVKTATLNNAKVSFNGKEPVELQAYNIDGLNYFRAREITDGLGMQIDALGNDAIGIRIYPKRTPDTIGKLEMLTDKSISVTMVEGILAYEGNRYPVQCFNYNGRYFFKIADFAETTASRLEDFKELTRIYAKGGVKSAPPQENFSSITVNWNTSTSVIEVNRKTTDLWDVFTSEGGSASPKAEDTQKIVLDPSQSTLHPNTLKELEAMMNGTWQPITPNFQKQSPLTSPPKEGERLANILIDEGLGAYNEDGSLNLSNIQPFYKYNNLTGNFGQCTWYAEGRFSEVTGVDSSENQYWAGTGKVEDWLENVTNNECPDVIAIHDIEDIREQSIAVFKGHVVFVEYVERNETGQPANIYYTDANSHVAGSGYIDGKYYPETNCRVKKVTFEHFKSLQWGTLKGYIIAN